MGVDHCDYRAFTQVAVRKIECGTRRWFNGQWVDHNPARIARYERDIRDVIAPHLPNAFSHLEQSMGSVQLRLAPQARVNRVRVLPVVDEVVT
jgi:hypothetical protein